MRTLLSTTEVAALMNVTETTIKRWAEGGKLACVKTPGGHRKFLLKDVVQFADDHSYPLTGVFPPDVEMEHKEILEFSIQTQNYNKISEIVFKKAIQADRAQLLDLLVYLVKHRISMSVIGDEIIRPAMVKIGDLWMANQLEINQEHLASQALLEAIIRLSPDLYRKPANGLTAVCACVEGDYHEIGLRIMSYVLECEGWSVSYLGTNTPFDTLVSFMKTTKPNLVCLSLTMEGRTPQFLRKMRSIGETAHSHHGTFVVGGFTLGKYSEKDFGCDHISTSTYDAVGFLKDRFNLRPGPKKQMHGGVQVQQ
jgi:excisionase family DNA binding protein